MKLETHLFGSARETEYRKLYKSGSLVLSWAFLLSHNSARNVIRMAWKFSACLVTLFLALNSAEAGILNDFDGDGVSDLAVWRPSDGAWYVIPTSGSCPPYMSSFGVGCRRQWGLSSDQPIRGDYDGLDSRNDYTVFRPSNLYWYIRYSAFNGTVTQQFGLGGDIPLKGDFDGDNKTDIAVYRPSNSKWYMRWSSAPTPTQVFTKPNEDANSISLTPIPSYFQNTSQTNRAIYEKFSSPSSVEWSYYFLNGTGDANYSESASASDIPVLGDYDGDGLTDFCRWKPSNGNWYILTLLGQRLTTVPWGLSGDIPVAGDYTGDGIDDRTVWRPSTGTWFVKPSSGGCPSGMSTTSGGCYRQWGASGDHPLSNHF